MLVVVFAAATVAGLVPSLPAAAQLTPTSCGFAQAGTGTYASTICWIDFASYSPALATSASGQPMTVSLPGGYTASFTAAARPVPGYTDISSCVSAYALPYNATAWPLGGQAYTGIPGEPGLLNGSGNKPAAGCSGSGRATNLELNDIAVTDAAGAPVTSYGVVSTEAEASTTGEGITWSSDSTLSRVDQINPGGAGCTGSRVTGFGTTTVSCTGSKTSTASGWGTSLVLAESPAFFDTASLNPSSILGTAYGFVISRVQLSKAVAGRVHSTDSFDLAVSAGSSVLASASTGSAGTASTGPVTVLSGGSFQLSESATPGSGTDLGQYARLWSCDLNGTYDPALSGSTAAAVTVSPDIGDLIDCTVTNTPLADGLAVSKTARPAPYVPGQPLTYTVRVTNTGQSDAEGAHVSDPLPPELAGQAFTWTCTATAGSSCTPSGSGDINDTVNVAIDGTLIYTVTGTVPPALAGTLANTATVTPPPGATDPDCSPDCSATTTTPARLITGMSVTKTSAPDPYVPGAPLTYTVTVSNSGPSDAAGARVSDPLPPELAGHGFTWTCTATAGSTCSASGAGDIDDTVYVAAGGQLVYTVTGTVPSATTGRLVDTATVTPPPGAADPGCTPGCTASNPNPAGPDVALAVTKTAAPSPYVPGQALTYTITVTNAGPSDAAGATVTDSLPSELAGHRFSWTCTATAGSSCTGSGDGNIDDTVNVAAAGRLVYTITGIVSPSTQGTLTNIATVTPPSADTDAGCTPSCAATVDLTAHPDVELSDTKTAAPSPYVPGQPLTYTVTVTNAGPSDALSATVSDPLPGELAGQAFTWTCVATAGSNCTASGDGDIVDMVDVAAGGRLVYIVTGIVAPSTQGMLTNTATLSPPAGAADPECSPDCSARISTDAQPSVSLTVNKTSSPDPYRPGRPFTYLVRVSNHGPSDAVDVRVTDSLPGQLEGGRFTWTCTATLGSHCTPTGTGNLDDTVTVAAVGHLVYTVTGIAPASPSGQLVNTVTLIPPSSATDPACTPHCQAINTTPPAGIPTPPTRNPAPPTLPVTGLTAESSPCCLSYAGGRRLDHQAAQGRQAWHSGIKESR